MINVFEMMLKVRALRSCKNYAHTVLGGSHLEGKTRGFSNKSKDWIPPTIPNSVFVFSFTKSKFTVLIRYLGGLIFKEKYMFF